MFNAPRRTNASLSQSAFFHSPSSSSGAYIDPLAASVPGGGGGGGGGAGGSGFGDVDPWSGMPSPARSGTPGSGAGAGSAAAPISAAPPLMPALTSRESEAESLVPPAGAGDEDAYTRLPGLVARVTGGGGGAGDGLKGFMADPPALYLALLDQIETTPSGEIPLSGVQRLLSTAQLPASTVEKIITLTSHDKATLTRPEFFVLLALTALAQSDQSNSGSGAAGAEGDVSIERLSSSIPHLPLPRLSASPPSPALPSSPLARPFAESNPSYLNAGSPWDTSPRINGSGNGVGVGATSRGYALGAGTDASPGLGGPADSAGPGGQGYDYGFGFGSERDGEDDVAQGGAGGDGDAGAGGPQGMGAAALAERGYWHRVEKVDVRLVEKEGWFLQKYHVESDKRNAGALSRRYSDFVWLLDTMLKRYPFRILPSLPPKKIGPDATFLEQRRKGLKRFINMLTSHPILREDGALAVFLTEPSFEAWRKRVKVSSDEEFASRSLAPGAEMRIPADLDEKLGVLRDKLPALLASYQKLVTLAERSVGRLQAANADATRMALGLSTVGEEMPACCYRAVSGGGGGDGARAEGHGEGRACSLCIGVGRGLGEVAEGWTRVAEEGEKRAARIVGENIEALKTQRDLYLAFRDLFVRHDRLSKDNVDALRKRIETKTRKSEALRHPTQGMKPGWEAEVDKLTRAAELDAAEIARLMARRVMVRECMWHELAVVFHSRQAAGTTLGWREFVGGEREAVGRVGRVWEGLEGRLERMPVE